MTKKTREWLTTAPSFLWLTLLLLVPTILVLAIAFKPADPLGGIGKGWTFSTIRSLSIPSYPAIIMRTLWQGLATTAICIVLSIPMAYYMARTSEKCRHFLMVLTIVPFWVWFVVRVFAWKYLLHPDGFIRHSLLWLGVIDADTFLLYSPATVLLVMVYNHLPFAILPIFAAAEKFDYQLFEAAQDLGSTRFRAFMEIFLPGIKTGIITAILMVLIPALGEYVIPDMVGGVDSEMIGSKIAQRTFADKNLPHACALSAFLIFIVLIPMIAVIFHRDKKGKGGLTGDASRRVKGVIS